MCDKISFVGVAHLTRGGRSCSCLRYHVDAIDPTITITESLRHVFASTRQRTLVTILALLRCVIC